MLAMLLMCYNDSYLLYYYFVHVICRSYSYMDCLFSFYPRLYVFTFYVTFIPITVCECHIELKATWLDLTWLDCLRLLSYITQLLTAECSLYKKAELRFSTQSTSSPVIRSHFLLDLQYAKQTGVLQVQVRSCGTALQLNCDKLTLAFNDLSCY